MVKEADKEVLAFLLVMASPTVYARIMLHRETSVPFVGEATHMAILQVKGRSAVTWVWVQKGVTNFKVCFY